MYMCVCVCHTLVWEHSVAWPIIYILIHNIWYIHSYQHIYHFSLNTDHFDLGFSISTLTPSLNRIYIVNEHPAILDFNVYSLLFICTNIAIGFVFTRSITLVHCCWFVHIERLNSVVSFHGYSNITLSIYIQTDISIVVLYIQVYVQYIIIQIYVSIM